MTIRWTQPANDDFLGIVAWVNEHNPAAASRVGRRILDAVKRLDDFPLQGRPGRSPDTRELVITGQQVSNFDRSAYKGPLGIDSAMDTSDVVEELRGGRIDFVARYYRDPTSSLPALSSQEARKLASLGVKIVAVWEQNSPDPEKSFLLFWL